jgi:hypothetical protein
MLKFIMRISMLQNFKGQYFAELSHRVKPSSTGLGLPEQTYAVQISAA